MKLDVLAIVAHPDDAELSMGGTLIKLAQQGKQVGVADLTRGELGSRGTPELRAQEAAAASQVMSLAMRHNLGLADGFFEVDMPSLLSVIQLLRTYRPTVVLTNAPEDRHPDHGRACGLVKRACFLSGLLRIETNGADGQPQACWRPAQLFHAIQDNWLMPSFVVDITDTYEQKMAAIRCYASQFWQPDGQSVDGPQTPISTQEFWDSLQGRAKEMGHFIRTQYAEGFIADGPLWAHTPLDFVL
jgi:bacillithiol biosynthesis deacetylase BshB1